MDIARTVDKHGSIYYKNEKGQLHREDGPAYESSIGDKGWLINGEYNREDGPAYESIDGHKAWYIKGKKLTEQEFNDFLLRKRLQKIMEL